MNYTFEQLPEAVSQLHEKLVSIENLLKEKTAGSNTQPNELLTVHHAAEFLSLSVPTIYGLISKGELPVMKRSKRCYFSKSDLMDYLKAGRKKTNSEISLEAESLLKSRKK